MKALLQRVAWAEVQAGGETVARIGRGLIVYLGVALTDTSADAERLAAKAAGLRVFEDEQEKMNLSVRDVGGDVLAVSSFTLLADAKKGRRPAFAAAAPGLHAEPLYCHFVLEMQRLGCKVQRGVFGASMKIRSEAEGPVNIIIETPEGV